jgi:predicted NBD/HSP70 family sugar kinase
VEHYAGLDVSLEQTSVCVVDAQGEVVREAKVASEPEAYVPAPPAPSSLLAAISLRHLV